MKSNPTNELPTNPGTPSTVSSSDKIVFRLPAEGRLTAGELRNFINIFRSFAEDIKVLEKKQEAFEEEQSKDKAAIKELQRVVGRIDTLASNFSGQLETFMTEIRRLVKGLKT